MLYVYWVGDNRTLETVAQLAGTQAEASLGDRVVIYARWQWGIYRNLCDWFRRHGADVPLTGRWADLPSGPQIQLVPWRRGGAQSVSAHLAGQATEARCMFAHGAA